MDEFYLKILSGSHIGAEIPLEPGRHTLGKGSACDLILADAALSDIEITIVIDPDGSLSITTENEAPLYLNGTPATNKLTPEHFDVVTSSGVHFALGPADAHWPEIEIPSLQKPEPQQEIENEKTASAEDKNEDHFPDPDASGDDNTSPETHANSKTDDNELTLDIDDQDTDQIGIKQLLAIVATFFILMTVFAMFLFSEPEPTPKKSPESSMSQATSIKNRLQLDDIKFRQLPDGTILVRGYIQTRENKENLLSQLKTENIPFRSQVIVMNEMKTNAEALLKSRGYKNLTLEQDTTPGSLILTGYVISSDQLNKITSMLKEEIYGLTSIIDNVQSQSGRVKSLKSMLRDKGLALRVHLVERPGKVLIQGTLLDQGQAYELDELVNKFRSLYNDQPTLIVAKTHSSKDHFSEKAPLILVAPTVTKKQPEAAPIPIVSVRGVSMGATPYLITKDSGKYLIGAKLDNGYIIEDINLDYLLLSDGSQQIKYHLGGKSSEKTKK